MFSLVAARRSPSSERITTDPKIYLPFPQPPAKADRLLCRPRGLGWNQKMRNSCTRPAKPAGLTTAQPALAETSRQAHELASFRNPTWRANCTTRRPAKSPGKCRHRRIGFVSQISSAHKPPNPAAGKVTRQLAPPENWLRFATRPVAQTAQPGGGSVTRQLAPPEYWLRFATRPVAQTAQPGRPTKSPGKWRDRRIGFVSQPDLVHKPHNPTAGKVTRQVPPSQADPVHKPHNPAVAASPGNWRHRRIGFVSPISSVHKPPNPAAGRVTRQVAPPENWVRFANQINAQTAQPGGRQSHPASGAAEELASFRASAQCTKPHNPTADKVTR